MKLQVLTSKKGTKVVTASNLHAVLQLANHHFAMNVKKWLNDVYEFRDGIRKPEKMRDFARRKIKDNPILDDYYISVELAKLITLNSRSKVKQKYAKWLYSIEDKAAQEGLLTYDQVVAVMELTKTLGLVSCQEACEQQHLKVYEDRNGGSANNWWSYRASILGYSIDRLKQKMQKAGVSVKGKSARKLLMKSDKYEMIRTGVIDLFMAMGKDDRFARSLGDLAKLFAKELQVEIFDDRGTLPAFSPKVNPEVVKQVKQLEKSGVLGVWQ
jgi:phage anti-repressor protein